MIFATLCWSRVNFDFKVSFQIFFCCVQENRLATMPDWSKGHGLMVLGCIFVFEASNPFVLLRSILYDLGMSQTPLYLANGLVLVPVFFLFRIANFPLFFYIYASSQKISFQEALSATPMSCYFYMTLITLPQIYWFYLLLRGAFKTLIKFRRRRNILSMIKQQSRSQWVAILFEKYYNVQITGGRIDGC